jgi:hypothetical protein
VIPRSNSQRARTSKRGGATAASWPPNLPWAPCHDAPRPTRAGPSCTGIAVDLRARHLQLDPSAHRFDLARDKVRSRLEPPFFPRHSSTGAPARDETHTTKVSVPARPASLILGSSS